MGHLRLELWAVPRTGEAYPLPDLAKWSAAPRDDEAGLLEFTYPITGRYYDRLAPIVDDDVDLDVEARLITGDGRDWRNTFILDELDDDLVEETGHVVLRGLDHSLLFDEAVLPYHPTGENGETPASGTAGRIAREILGAARGRGCLTGVTWTFTDSHDSNGVPWAKNGVLRFSPGQTARAVLGTLRGSYLAEWRLTADRELVLVNVEQSGDGYGLGVDRTTGANPLTLERGRDLADAPRKWRLRGAVTALFTSGKDGIRASASDSSAQARRGRRIEGFHSFGNTADQGTLNALTQARLTSQTRGKTEIAHKVVLGPSSPTPLIDYLPADRVYSATRKGVDKRRVRQIVVDGEADGAVACSVVCGDLLDEAAVRLADKVDAMASGAEGVGTSAPPPETDDGSTPAAPGSLVLSSLWYATNEGAGASQATGVWQSVPDSRVTGYAFEWRYPGTMDFSPLGEVNGTSVSWSSLRPGALVEARVAAVNKWGRRSTWTTATTTLESDGTPPPRLSTPTPYPALGLLVVGWDGRGSAGEAMPGDFLAGEVHLSPTSGFTAHRPLLAGSKHIDVKASSTYAGELRAGGELPIDVGTAAYGTTMYVVLVPKDRTGNAGPQSAQASVVPRAVQDGEIAEMGVGKLRTGILTALVAVAGRLYAGDPNGAGWEGDPAGFRFWGMRGSTRVALLEFIAATSRLVLRGTFEALGDGNAAIGIYPESLPVIRFFSPNGAHGPGFINATDWSGDGSDDGITTQNGTAVGINSGPHSSSPTIASRRYTRLFLRPTRATLEMVDGNQGGNFGQVEVRQSGVRLRGPSFSIANPTGSQLTMQTDGFTRLGGAGNNYIDMGTGTAGGMRFVVNGTVLTPKSFVIPHPLDDPDRPERWLVHACTESPVAAVEYTGEVVVVDSAVVELPDYFEALVEDEGRTVQVSVVLDDPDVHRLALVAATPVREGRFTVRTSSDHPVRVAWHVRGARRDTGFEVEPARADYDAHGDGPYRYLTPKEDKAA